MKPLHLAAAPLLVLALVGGTRVPTDDKAHATADPRLESDPPLIAEFDLRRRVNVLFPNPQTLFDGLQAGFDNVGSGNLTFLRRDLVARTNIPLVFGRVYDSRLKENGDFGPGWRLSLAEELHIDDADIIYVDGAGTRQRFVPGADGHRPLKPTSPDAGPRIVLDDDLAALHEGSGAVRTFKPVGAEGSWPLASVDAYGQRLDFSYRNGRLESVVLGTRTMFHIERNDADRIAHVTDDHGRSVRYSYTARGQLEDVYDVAGKLWWHEYDADGRLTAAIGTDRQPYLEVRYDGQGRVRHSRTGREYTFADERPELVRVTERPSGEHAGTEDMIARGDFDGDGSQDEAYFVRADGGYALVLALNGVDELVVLSAGMQSLARSGIRTLPPGKYTAYCADRFARRGNRDCAEGTLRELLTKHDSIRFFTYEAAAMVLYWDNHQLYELYWED